MNLLQRWRAVTNWGALVATLVAGLGWGLTLPLILRLISPSSSWHHEFTSDSAIPVLVTRARTLDVFHLFYFGQDRFGMWPFLLARALGGTNWTAEGLQRVMFVMLWPSALVLGALVPSGPMRRGLWLFIPLLLVLSPGQERYLLDLSQPYGWQVVALVWSWLALRGQAKAAEPPRVVAYGALAFLAATLAMWISSSSLPSLLVLAGLEVAKARLEGTGRARAWRLAPLVPLLGAFLVERELLVLYHRFSRQAFGHAYRTDLMLDRGYLLENARQVLGQLMTGPAPALLVLAALVAAVLWGLVAARRQGRPPSPTTWFAAGCALVALSQIPALVLIQHVRLNAYNPRYFCLILLFAQMGLGAVVLSELAARVSPRIRHAAGIVLVGGLLVAGPVFPPTPPEHLRHTHARAAALALSEAAPGTLLLGNYWCVYLIAALQPPDERAARPLPQDGDYQRTPFYIPAMKTAADAVWVQTEAEEPVPPTRQVQHGVELERDAAPMLRRSGFAFWHYRVLGPAPRMTESVP
ncbi:hypothetical protein KRR26_03755 [Corallococcus sp. M34]|uniref:hypothetical protein n=1 Tax=Citreicoccus inhibens TaxID=2849499 RepID=UPI001C20F7FD|nr:hypothetical protein [Citreicoccus inhibens]MBU8894701.1 hypothetical protein [Citreicoccus inhibens]